MSGPLHVPIIMDGNGRWAEQRGLPRVAGYERRRHGQSGGLLEGRAAGFSANAVNSRACDQGLFPVGFVLTLSA